MISRVKHEKDLAKIIEDIIDLNENMDDTMSVFDDMHNYIDETLYDLMDQVETLKTELKKFTKILYKVNHSIEISEIENHK